MVRGRRLTVLIIPEEGGGTYEYKVPRPFVWLAGVVAALLLVLLGFGVHAMVGADDLQRRVVRLQRDKDILVEEVQRIDQLETTLQRLQASNAQLRQITAEAVGLRHTATYHGVTRVGEQLIPLVERLRHGRLTTVPTMSPVRFTTPTQEGEVLVYRPPGRSLVRATASGRVVSWRLGPEGDVRVRLDHGNGVVTEYEGLSTTTIEDGQFVQKGQPLGLSHPWLAVRFTLIEDGVARLPEPGELWL